MAHKKSLRLISGLILCLALLGLSPSAHAGGGIGVDVFSAPVNANIDGWYMVDLGDGDQEHITEGFDSNTNVSPFPCVIGGIEDTTARYQRVGHHNQFWFDVTPGRDLEIYTCVEQGSAQDDWTLFINGYRIIDSTSTTMLPAIYHIVIPGEILTDEVAVADFCNWATDANGKANTYIWIYRQT